MKLLVIGGTVFVGRALVEEALRRGHDVTTFNRGRTAADPDGVTAVRGDRAVESDLAQLADGEWDAVVDTCGFVPRVVGASAALLASRAPAYAFVSTVGVYRDWPKEPADETAPLFDCAPTAGPDDGDYGTLKAGCERAVAEVYGERALLLRPGIILGPYENVGRGPWWLQRVARGGRVLAPGDPSTPLQVIDARDLAAFTLDALEQGLGGPYNMVSRPGHTTFGSWLETCAEVTGSDAELVWVDDATLVAAGVQEWFELPLWMPQADAPHRWGVDVDRAHRDGLRCRPMGETVRDTWQWMQAGGSVPPPRPGLPSHGIDAEKEQRILAEVTEVAG